MFSAWSEWIGEADSIAFVTMLGTQRPKDPIHFSNCPLAAETRCKARVSSGIDAAINILMYLLYAMYEQMNPMYDYLRPIALKL